MNAHASHPRPGRSPRPFLLSALLLAALLAVSAARSQPPAPPPPPTGADSSERLRLVRTGTFEVWQDTTRLGTEFYRVYMNPQGDSLIAVWDCKPAEAASGEA